MEVGGAGHDDAWIEELWQAIDASESAEAFASLLPCAFTALLPCVYVSALGFLILGLLCLACRPDAAAPESKVASSVASRVAAASSLASDAAAAFGADKRRPPATPDAARVMVLAEQMEENYPGEMGKIEEKIDEKLAESKALEMAAEEDQEIAEMLHR